MLPTFSFILFKFLTIDAYMMVILIYKERLHNKYSFYYVFIRASTQTYLSQIRIEIKAKKALNMLAVLS